LEDGKELACTLLLTPHTFSAWIDIRFARAYPRIAAARTARDDPFATEESEVITPGVWYCLLFMLATQLCGCVSATRIIRNDEAAIQKYSDVYLIPPKEDPRGVVPKVIAEFKAIGLNVMVADPKRPLEGEQGTGFVVSRDGHVITCAHVLGEENSATVWSAGVRYEADVLSKDKDKDLAVLKLRGTNAAGWSALSFKDDKQYSLGSDVFTIGYPLSSILGNNARLTKGSISALGGFKDDPNQIQISAQIQPGNSGGPLLDQNGVLVGVVQQTLNPLATMERTGGALPQNVNFAIRGDVVLDYLRTAQPDLSQKLVFNQDHSFDDVQRSVVKVRSGIIAPELEKRPKLVARLQYKSIWDGWYRFRLFVVYLYDFDSHQPLLAAGQGRDNLISNEEVVIKDTFAEIKRALNKG